MTRDTDNSYADILNLNNRTVEAIDYDTALDRILESFTPDAVWVMKGAEHRGTDAIRDMLQGTRDAGFAGPEAGTKHIVTGHQIYVDDNSGTAHGSSQWLLIQSATAPELPALRGSGRYIDEYVNIDGTWLIKYREVAR